MIARDWRRSSATGTAHKNHVFLASAGRAVASSKAGVRRCAVPEIGHARATFALRGRMRLPRVGDIFGAVNSAIARYREAAGVEAFQINFHGNRNVEQLIDSMECFMREVKP